jgi:hypothetical protein
MYLEDDCCFLSPLPTPPIWGEQFVFLADTLILLFADLGFGGDLLLGFLVGLVGLEVGILCIYK